MQTRTMGPAAGWAWLVRAINLGRNNPRALFGGAALLMLVALIPSAIQFISQQVLGPGNVTAFLWVVGLTTIAMIVVFPLLIGGFYRVIDATENGQPTHATALFDTFRAGQGRGRLIGVGLILTLVYLLALALVFGTVGRDVAVWYWHLITIAQTAAPGATPAIPSLPHGLGTVFALSLLVMMFTGGIYAIAFGQVALAGRGVGAAVADGLAGTVKNVLPLLVLTLIGLVAMILAALAIGLVVLLLALLGGLVHPLLGVVLAVPVYVAFLVMVYVVMFGVMYFIWRDICGPEPTTPATTAADVTGFEA